MLWEWKALSIQIGNAIVDSTGREMDLTGLKCNSDLYTDLKFSMSGFGSCGNGSSSLVAAVMSSSLDYDL